jgi:ABC-type cobalt transport system substrate-binding protein
MILSQNIYGYGSWVVIFIVLFDILVYQSTHEGYYRNVPDEGYYRNVPGEKMTRRKWELCNLPLYQQPRGSYYSCHFWFSMQSFLGACCICYILSGRDLTSFAGTASLYNICIFFVCLFVVVYFFVGGLGGW